MLDAIDSDFQRFGNPSRESQSTQAGIRLILKLNFNELNPIYVEKNGVLMMIFFKHILLIVFSSEIRISSIPATAKICPKSSAGQQWYVAFICDPYSCGMCCDGSGRT
jgi:hypothetical protein